MADVEANLGIAGEGFTSVVLAHRHQLGDITASRFGRCEVGGVETVVGLAVTMRAVIKEYLQGAALWLNHQRHHIGAGDGAIVVRMLQIGTVSPMPR